MTDAPPPAARNPFGWIALGLLLLMTVYGLVSKAPTAAETSLRSRWLETIHSALVKRDLNARFGHPRDDAWLQTLEKQLEPWRRDPLWDAYWIALRAELRESVPSEDVRRVADSTEPAFHDIGAAYAMRPASPQKAEALARVLDERGDVSRLAATHLREAAGLPNPRGWIRAATDRYLLILGVYGVLGVACAGAWALFAAAASSGRLPKRGPPYVAHSLDEADRLAMRGAALLFTFSFASLPLIALHLSTPVRTIVAGIVMLFAVPAILRGRPSFEEIVRYREGFGRKALLGLWAYLLEIPVVLVVSLVATRLFQGLPSNEHPAATALMHTHDALTIASLLFFGAVTAPYWEETLFRGLIFPGLSRLFNQPVVAALLSSFLFACVHPQGPGGWIGLMAFAVCSCVLTNRTRSLVPSMVMHAAHNATLLGLTVLYAS